MASEGGVLPILQQPQHPRRRIELLPAPRPTRRGFGVLAPLADLPILVDMGRRPGLDPALGGSSATASASSAEPVSDVMTCSAARLKASQPVQPLPQSFERGLRLRHMDDPLRQIERHTQILFRPGEHRIPMLVLLGDQPFGPFGAITEQDRTRRRQ